MFSCEICEIFKNTSFLQNSSSGCFWRLTRIFKGVRAKAVFRKYLFCKKDVLKNFAKFTRKHLCQSLFFKKVAKVFSCEFYEIFKHTFFHRTPPVAASVRTKTGATASDKYSTRFNWKKIFVVTKISTRKIIPEFFYPFILES